MGFFSSPLIVTAQIARFANRSVESRSDTQSPNLGRLSNHRSQFALDVRDPRLAFRDGRVKRGCTDLCGHIHTQMA
jgi:hypothetical protein